ncbi:MAG: hypothetical protein HUU15_11475, partial [Candidatus Brocadiae bacterium]|nr:hypothetical protein [Candidatus Brocadiia bacterium]
PGAGERRRGLARRAGAEARRIADGDFLETPEGQAFSVEFQRWIQALCEETGLPPGEATFSPDGLWAFFLEAFASADPPLPDDARRAFEERLAAFRGEWDAYAAARPGLTPMERARETSNFWPALYEAVGDTFPEPFVEAARAAFDDFNLATPTESKWFSGQRSQVQEQISRSISADLGLDDRRQAALGPLVDAFMRRTEEANRLGIDGSRESRRRVARAQYDAMLLLQKDIAATLSLDAGQAGRVRDWETLYGFQLLE